MEEEVTPDAIVSSSNAGSSQRPDAVLSSHVAEACPSPVKSEEKSSSKRKRSLPSPVRSSLSQEKRKRPTAEECKLVVSALGEIHPDVVEENNKRRDGFIKRKKMKKQKSNTAI